MAVVMLVLSEAKLEFLEAVGSFVGRRQGLLGKSVRYVAVYGAGLRGLGCVSCRQHWKQYWAGAKAGRS